MKRIQSVIVFGSLALHLGAWAFVGRLPKDKKQDTVAIALSESRKKEEAKKPPPPPPPPAEIKPKTPAPVKAPAPAPQPAPPEPATPPPPKAPSQADAPSALDGFADLGGIDLGAGGGGGTMPVAAGRPGGGGGGKGPAPAPVKRQKVLAPAGAADSCQEEEVKAALEKQVQPAYTSEGRQANVEGPVKLELTLDESGRVVDAKIIKGLGFGLDESAIQAAKQWVFKPATRCGKPVRSTVKGSVRFQLGS